MHEFGLRLIGHSAYDGVVYLLHLSVAKHPVETFQGLTGTRKHAHTAHGTVKPVRDAEVYRTGLGAAFLDIGFHVIGQRAVAGLVTLDNVADGLADDDDVVVFVENVRHILVKTCIGGVIRLAYS